VHSVRVVGLYITVNYIKILSVGQRRFYHKFMPPVTINIQRSSCKVPVSPVRF
jgi:hypothetical protein